jgi:hypothetical protein
VREFDVFVSHATEDKDAIVRPLAEALQERGLKVWYDEFELRVGDSLRRKIDVGISRSRFGIVVLSRPFFAKGWSQYELDGLVTMAVSGKQVLLPLWHEISKDEVIRQSPSLCGQGCAADLRLRHQRDRRRARFGDPWLTPRRLPVTPQGIGAAADEDMGRIASAKLHDQHLGPAEQQERRGDQWWWSQVVAVVVELPAIVVAVWSQSGV